MEEIEERNEKPDFVKDLANFDKSKTQLHIGVDVKNRSLLKDLKLEKLWLVGAKEKDLNQIFSMVQPKYVNLYHFQAKELSCLESLFFCETLIVEWNTKASKLWDIKSNTNLKYLAIKDFSKINDFYALKDATQLVGLSLEGGIDKTLKVDSLTPISSLIQLEFLRLTNIRVKDETLSPISKLTNLKKLELSNQFPTREYACLAAQLVKVDCSLFNAFKKVRITGNNNELVYDTMITGSRKPFLLSSKDFIKIEKYEKAFEKMKLECLKKG